MTDAQLAVIGAGPKGLAIAAEAWALRRSGAAQTPRVVLVDSCGVAANWDGRNGYTDGRQRLGTAPDKDLGFPFAPSWGRASPRIDAEMREVTWAAHVQQGGRFAECIDRRRPQPTHAEWQRYLAWAAERVDAELVVARVRDLDVEHGRWRLGCYGAGGRV